MFRQLVAGPDDVLNNINSLFAYHPLQISAIIETVWLNRNNATSSQTSSPFRSLASTDHLPHSECKFFPGYDWPTSGPPIRCSPLPAICQIPHS